MTSAAEPQTRNGSWIAFAPLARGLLMAAIGFAIGVAIVAVVRVITGHGVWTLELSFSVGYVFALSGWLLGVGVWGRWGREWFGLSTKDGPKGWQRYLSFSTDHKVIGVQYLVTFLVLFFLAGLFAVLIRIQFLDPVDPVLSDGTYNRETKPWPSVAGWTCRSWASAPGATSSATMSSRSAITTPGKAYPDGGNDGVVAAVEEPGCSLS